MHCPLKGSDIGHIGITPSVIQKFTTGIAFIREELSLPHHPPQKKKKVHLGNPKYPPWYLNVFENLSQKYIYFNTGMRNTPSTIAT